MERQTVKDILEALAKRPEDRTAAEVRLVAENTRVPAALKRQMQHLEELGVPQAVDRLREQIATLQKSAVPPASSGDSIYRLQQAYRRADAEARREKNDQRSRDIETLRTLQAIYALLQDQRTELERLAAKAQEHEEELARLRTGGAGRGSAMHLVLEELKRRGAEGKLEGTQAAQARVLAAWLRKAYPRAARTGAKAMTNNAEFRSLYRQFAKPLPVRKRPK
jgi:hypothetical protein